MFSFSAHGLAQELESDPAVQSFIAMQEAIKNGDYEKAWQLQAKNKQRFVFNNNLEDFEEFYSHPEIREEFINLKIQGARHLTDTAVALISSEALKCVSMVKEDGIWKFQGHISRMIEGVMNQIAMLNLTIGRYYAINGSLPHELSELVPNHIIRIPIDPFNDEWKPFAYKVKGDGWVVYSFGPDRKDDGGLIEFDIREGILSSGDIVLPPSERLRDLGEIGQEEERIE